MLGFMLVCLIAAPLGNGFEFLNFADENTGLFDQQQSPSAKSLPPTIHMVPVSGDPATGVLEQLDDDEITFNTGEDLRRLPIRDLAEIRFAEVPDPPLKYRFKIGLCDRSVLMVEQVTISDGLARTESPAGWGAEFRANAIASIQFDLFENNSELQNQWIKLLDDSTRTGDGIVVLRDGELETIEGKAGALQNDKIAFTIGNRTANIELRKIVGCIFYQSNKSEFRNALAMAQLTDGSILYLQRVSWRESELLGTTLCGLNIVIPAENLGVLDFAMGRVVFLDDLTPATNDWKPLLASNATVPALRKLNLARLKENFAGQPLILLMPAEGSGASTFLPRSYQHGFAIRGGGRLAFTLDGQSSRLQGWIGFAPTADVNGNVKLTIRGDAAVLLETVLKKSEMNEPLKLDLNIEGVQRIAFQVDYQDLRSIGDELHAVDLKVSK